MTGEWFAVNADGTQPRPLIFHGTRDATQRSNTVGNQRFSLLDTLKDDDQYVLMQARPRRSAEGMGTKPDKLAVLRGRGITLARAPRVNSSISVDAAKETRLATCPCSLAGEGQCDERSEKT